MDFIILIDALRHDFIDQESMPFVSMLASRATRATVVETYAFQTRPAFFAGLTPDESGICHLFKYSPETSPFGFLAPISRLLYRMDPWGNQRLGRGILKRLARHILRQRGETAAAAVLGTERIPLHLLPFFAPAETRYTDEPRVFGSTPTVFDELRTRGRSWNWIGYPRHFGSSASIMKTYLKAPKADVAYLHLSELDWTGHKYGPDSHEMRTMRTQIDSVIRSIVEPELQHGAKVIVFGDHGMAAVTHRLDLESLLTQLPLIPGKDYVPFLDSTMARFWFLTHGAEEIVRAALGELSEGHILSESERKALGISKREHGFGDLIFAIDGPGIIHPSFFDRSPAGPKGMHGYLPAVEDNKTTILLYPEEPKHLGTIQMVEMAEMMKRHLRCPALA